MEVYIATFEVQSAMGTWYASEEIHLSEKRLKDFVAGRQELYGAAIRNVKFHTLKVER